jgi:diguanylate cyclase (GGDEF)-like protein
MLHIDPALLGSTRQSPYRHALQVGYRWLRFEHPLEREFQRFHADAHVSRMRWAGSVGIALFLAFVLIDYTTVPAEVWAWTIPIRFAVVASLLAALWASHRGRWRRHLQAVLLLASTACGLGTVAIIGAALRHGFALPYEGILLVPLFVFLIACLQWWPALLAMGLTLAVFIGMELTLQPDPTARLYQIIFMGAATAVGALGGYFLEHSTRTTFLVHALLNELAERDGLTGLYNRRALNTHLDKLWRQAQRDGSDLGVAMVDVDFFKRYNDRYGHGAGDAALKAVATLVAGEARRPLDLAARYGGEEFVLVWHRPAAEQLADMGEQLRAGVAALGLEHAGSESGTLSVSIGIAAVKPVQGRPVEDLLHAADTALYEAKHGGRNRVVVLAYPPRESVLFPLAGSTGSPAPAASPA